jgi:hypothetical protein
VEAPDVAAVVEAAVFGWGEKTAFTWANIRDMAFFAGGAAGAVALLAGCGAEVDAVWVGAGAGTSAVAFAAGAEADAHVGHPTP